MHTSHYIYIIYVNTTHIILTIIYICTYINTYAYTHFILYI